MIYFTYLIAVVAIVFFSNKASQYVDLLDKKTKLSGAFIGGVLLSAVTSLPELFTSLSSTLFLDKPELSIGNILGSNLFNVAALAVIVLLFLNIYKDSKISNSHLKTCIFVLVIYVLIFLKMINFLNFDIGHVNITSILILIVYVIGIKSMSSDTSAENEDEDTNPLTVKQVLVRFAAVAVGIVITSIIITYITDEIATIHNLGAGFAGALFLGVATSLPELSSTIALFKLKNVNIAIGNIVGSNLFNFIILVVADFTYNGSGVYNFTDPKTLALLIYGIIATPFVYLLLRTKNKMLHIICSILIILCYVLFLVL